MASQTQILLLGAGELGLSFLAHLSSLPNVQITAGVRTVSKYAHLSGPNVTLIALDTTAPSTDLAQTFARYDIVISATGFGQPLGTVTKLANEILEAGKLKRKAGKDKLWFFPWQWGIDYDITKDGGGLMPLFGEQLSVRNLLREKSAHSHVKWTVVSTGIFMSFLFEQFWGIVDRQGDKLVVRALKSWDHKVMVTDVNDIGKVLGKIVADDVESEDRVLYVAGDTVSYRQLADIVEGVTGKPVERQEWSIPYLKSELEKDPDDDIKKYRLIFAGEGTWWDKEAAVNHKMGMSLVTVGDYAKKLLA